jgi:hypothetical protein
MPFTALALPLVLAASPPLPAPYPESGFHRGAVLSSWDGTYPHREAWAAALDRLQALGVTWVEVLTFAEQPDIARPEIVPESAERWPAAFIDAARARGFRIFLKPDVWSRQFYAPGSKLWRGSIRMESDSAWAAWFDAYERFIVAEARNAAAHGVEMFSVGLEYVEITRTQGARWRSLIGEIRKVYPGVLTYSADGNHEMAHVDFWDALDVIGVNAYFALADSDSPTYAELLLGLVGPMARMGALSARWGRPVVLTEVGVPSVSGAARTPWRWPQATDAPDAPLQSRVYEALLAQCAAASFCRGMYWWKFYEIPERHIPEALDYTPEGKPAAEVLRAWYTAPAGGVETRVKSDSPPKR